jgi:hypothetical protein
MSRLRKHRQFSPQMVNLSSVQDLRPRDVSIFLKELQLLLGEPPLFSLFRRGIAIEQIADGAMFQREILGSSMVHSENPAEIGRS